jgi:hypothetical protein
MVVMVIVKVIVVAVVVMVVMVVVMTMMVVFMNNRSRFDSFIGPHPNGDQGNVYPAACDVHHVMCDVR